MPRLANHYHNEIESKSDSCKSLSQSGTATRPPPSQRRRQRRCECHCGHRCRRCVEWHWTLRQQPPRWPCDATRTRTRARSGGAVHTSSRRDCESSQWCPVHHDCPRCQLEWRAATQCGKRQKVSKFSRVRVAIVIQGAKRRRVHARSSGCEPGGACVSFPKNLRALHLPPLSPYPKRTSAEHRILLLAP